MKKAWFKRFLYSVLALFFILIAVFIWADHELKKVLGSSTEEISISSIVKPSGMILIQNTNVLSEDCSYFKPNQDVVIKDGLIIKLGESQADETITTTIDGKGKYLIPGLVDSHVHLKESKNDLYLYLANGVTYVREMAGSTAILEWRKAIAKDGIGPRMFIASPPVFSETGLTGYYYAWTRQAVNFSDKDAASIKIKQLKEAGYDAVKMYGFVNQEMFTTTVAVAKENAIPVIGHIPLVSLDHFYSSGQKEVAHIEELTIKTIDDFGKSIARNPEEYLRYLKTRSEEIASKLKENTISVTSTVWLCESFAAQKFNLKDKLRTIELKYVNPKIIEGTSLYKLGWLPESNGYEYDGEGTAEARALSLTFWKTYEKAIYIMAKALLDQKVNIMAGTDSNVATAVPGFALHDELESLSKTGMTNSQVLYAATAAPGIWMKSTTGKIKIGYTSDLVLLSKNPLEAIKNTKSIDYVFFNKHVIDKAQIATILKEVERANNKNRSTDIDLFVKK